MHLLELECYQFRCLRDVRLEPRERVTLLQGNNAQGKTSVLEALLYAATSKSHRTNREMDLVTYGEHAFSVRAQARRSDREVAVDANWWRGIKRFKVNGVPQTRLSDILGKINVVLFSPEDIVLIKGTAAHRRRFLDMALSQVRPVYLHALQQYRQALRQRNELLRQPKPDPELLDTWDAQLAQHGTSLVHERAAFVARLADLATTAYERIASDEKLGLTYRPDVAPDQSLREALLKGRASDVHRGVTLRGPHRDEVDVRVAGQSARTFASQGQQKTAALALRLAEVELVKERSGEYPVLMLDEVLSELDKRRAERLFEAIDEQVQCLLTTTDLSTKDELFGAECCSYLIEDGKVAAQ